MTEQTASTATITAATTAPTSVANTSTQAIKVGSTLVKFPDNVD